MIDDILTMMWKEIKELPYTRGGRGGKFGLLIYLGLLGVLMPMQSGREWVTSSVGLIVWAWVPFLMVSSVIADSFAGERERHTLETLLASRLSDRAILYGKILAAVAYGWGLTLACILLGLITVNVVFAKGLIIIYTPMVGLGVVVLPLLVAGLSSGLGVLVSLRAVTVRQAQQTFSIAFFLLFIPLFILPMLPPEVRLRLAEILARTSTGQLLAGAVVILLVLNVVLIAAAQRRFQRARLVLD